MTVLKRIRRLLASFHYAIQGLSYAVKSQRNLKIHLVFASIAIGLSWLLEIPKLELLFILVVIGLVIALELVNTAIEAAIDLVTTDWHPLAKIAKDVAAGSVLVAVILAIIIGLYIFIPAMLAALNN